ncbi:Scr1 family TA system antitoxin-like transcriptional regulator [Streptomyces noursei]|uniref:Scr1 family TA system antitoxin-like transcriptional regulator n=1 Tax=Streptomyces noursei TaxID=1971 RepID=UPI0019641B16|nr:Scr1 family TA system antitoxin-like transcriptional regulator [Streptomyces noursei]QRX96835.1 transcriptional regulator [Streptomyces noursei]
MRDMYTPDDQEFARSLRAVEGMWIEWRRMERHGLRRAQEPVHPLFERTRWFQRVLHEGSATFAFLVEESVLRTSLGSIDTQVEQLERLHTVGALPNVSLGVVPMRTGRPRMPVEGFWIYDKAQVDVELVSGYLTLTQPTEVRAYAETFATLADSAVYGANAHRLIKSAIRSLV